MVLLFMLLLTAPALAQPADCPSVPVGPPMDVEIYVGLTGPAKPAAPITGGLGLTRLPSRGTICPAPPPPAGDVLRGTPDPQDLLRGNGPADLLSGRRTPEVLVGPAYPVPPPPREK